MISLHEAYKLLHRGALALAKVEEVGIRIDVDRLNQYCREIDYKINQLREQLVSSDVWRLWRRRFGDRANLGSRVQLGEVLFEEMGIQCVGYTPSGRYSVDEGALDKIDLPFVRDYLQMERYKKLLHTYLEGVKREVVDGYLHPSFNLHLVKTYRSSSDSPNFQNIPVRDAEVGRYIRSCFIPRDGCVLVEVDYSALEVRIAACYHKDPNMIRYIKDPSRDMHRDMAMKCFLIDKPDMVTKELRFAAKNMFVFPQFYGSYYVPCAESLWKVVEKGAKLSDGTLLMDHLKSRGICNFDAFVTHIQGVEHTFWHQMFSHYYEWRERVYVQYLSRGWFELLTGFRESGEYSRTDVINHPIQGAAFHCLLWSLIRIIDELEERRSGVKVVGQIHDSILADVPKEELEDYIDLVVQVMTVDIRKEWKWIIVPLEVEIELAENNWWEKHKVER